MSAFQVKHVGSKGHTCTDCPRTGAYAVTIAGHTLMSDRIKPDPRALFCRKCVAVMQEAWDGALEPETVPA